MNNLIAGVAIGTVTGASMMIADVVTTNSINLRDAFAIVGFIVPLVWWMGRKFKGIDDKLNDHTDRLKSLPCKEVKEGLQKVGKKLDCEQ